MKFHPISTNLQGDTSSYNSDRKMNYQTLPSIHRIRHSCCQLADGQRIHAEITNNKFHRSLVWVQQDETTQVSENDIPSKDD